MDFKELQQRLFDTCPFWNGTSIVTKVLPTGDKIFIWQYLPEDKLGDLYLPVQTKELSRIPVGLVIAAGPGYYNTKGFFRKNPIKIGDAVLFDGSTPWNLTIPSPIDNKSYRIRYMGAMDARIILSEDGEEIGDITPNLDGI